MTDLSLFDFIKPSDIEEIFSISIRNAVDITEHNFIIYDKYEDCSGSAATFALCKKCNVKALILKNYNNELIAWARSSIYAKLTCDEIVIKNILE